jgi:hypothetical protein
MLTDGRTFGEICAALVNEVGEVDGPPVAGNLLARWITEGMIGSVPGGLARQRLQPPG